MNNILIDISGKIEPHYIEALSKIKTAAESMGIPFIIVGATARDFILEHHYQIKSPRMTKYIDIVIEVSNWERYSRLIKTLLDAGEFIDDKRRKQRILYKDVIIDIIPYGKIANDDYMISWPPDHEWVLTTLGFEEAYKYSVTVRLEKDLEVQIPTLPGLIALKLISWKEKYPERKNDAEDIYFILTNYENAGNINRLYDEIIEILEEEKFDNSLASARLLGRDIA
ncbi:MAG: nucleotidyl transferase AbiEii/AbiGii toxin family protein, partial [Elusimicrobia bacterium]|nr:nucleotidyl transferase AbiEii/AbiGii toxin family protein [Elusimicrobiota bacterium]